MLDCCCAEPGCCQGCRVDQVVGVGGRVVVGGSSTKDMFLSTLSSWGVGEKRGSLHASISCPPDCWPWASSSRTAWSIALGMMGKCMLNATSEYGTPGRVLVRGS
eukprot:3900594-Pyramimonas_sp.AAC.1